MQLLRITTIPIKIKMKVESAKLQINQEPPRMKQKTVRSRLSIKKQDAKVLISTYELRKRLGQMKLLDSAREAARKGLESAQAATAEYAELGNKLAMAYKGVSVPEAAYSKLVKEPKSQKVFLPSVGAQLAWENASLDFDYDPGKLQTEWDTGSADLVYVPGNLELEIEQYPDVKIEYLGSPNYVPPSANPEYNEESDGNENKN